MRKLKSDWILLILIVIICCNLSAVELKRSFGIGRARPKASNPNVRRRGHVTETASINHRASHVSSDSSLKHKGPPPPYSAAPNAKNTHAEPAAPPPYSPSNANPPSYSAATGQSNPYNPSYPRQNYGFNTGSGVPYSGQGHAPNYGMGQTPVMGHTYNGGYNGYGGYSGGGMGHGMGGFSGGMGGFSGGMNGMGGYGHQKSSSPFSFGNILTGLAVWQLARGLGGSYGNHDRIYHVHHTNQQTTDSAKPIQEVASATGVEAKPPISVQPDATALPPAVTPFPETEFQYQSTMHPSLFPYGRMDESLVYWANSGSRVINTATNASDSASSTTTAAVAIAADTAAN